MGGKAHKSIYYHVVFATKNREPLINESIRDELYHFIWKKCKEMNLYLHRLGGVEDHIHMLLFIPPTKSVADAVGEIKGAASYFVNRALPGDDILYWQRGYGVQTISEKDAHAVREYIKRQKEHHARGDAIKELEEIVFGTD